MKQVIKHAINRIGVESLEFELSISDLQLLKIHRFANPFALYFLSTPAHHQRMITDIRLDQGFVRFHPIPPHHHGLSTVCQNTL